MLQTVLPALLSASGPSNVRVSGGTHNPASPPFEFVDECYVPALRAMGHTVSAELVQYGFFPAGGGEIAVSLEPAAYVRPLIMEARGAEVSREAEAIISNLSGEIAERELRRVGNALDVPPEHRHVRTRPSRGPGNALMVRLNYERLTADIYPVW